MKNPAADNSESTRSSTLIESSFSSSPNKDTTHRAVVSFREDVVFISTNGNSNRSSNGGGGASISESSSSSRYSNLRSGLTREQTNRDPFDVYQVTKSLGSGSMGDVMLVKKKSEKVGGSARRDLQFREKADCFRFFQACMDIVDSDPLASSSHHSVISIFGGGKDDATRSFEDALLNDDSESSSNKKDIIYALKCIHLTQMTQIEFVDELRNEIAILKDLDHPNIVRAIETFEFQGKISLVMELCSGGDLYSRDPYSEAEAARIISSILSAISYMHSRNIVHRDLKFENVLFSNMSPFSDVKLIDFGLSKVYVDTQLTDVSGTIYTMAPEVLKGHHTEKADMWSIGVIAYMLLGSRIPFYGKTRGHVVDKILKNKYSFKPSRDWRNVSPEAMDFIRDLLVTNPYERADAESALGSPWMMKSVQNDSTGNNIMRIEEEEMARSSILRYAGYPKLKKMALMVVAHKSSTEDIGILRTVFEKYDSRHDGSIWFEEFCEAMNGLGLPEEDLRFIFDAMDLAGDGRIRYTEFVAATIEAHGRISEARLAEAFDRLDSDDSGFITASDLIEILGKDVPMDEIDAIIAQADLTNDDRVSYSNFLALFENEQELAETNEENPKALVGRELSTITVESDDSKTEGTDAHAEFLKEKHLQNTLHAWAMEMQLPAHVFVIGCSFLHQVALGNQCVLERILEERPTLVNFRDYDRRTALHVAASEGKVDICQFLIQKGARVNRSDRWGGSPLDDAYRHGHSDVLDLLREHGAKFGSTSQIANLITAASKGNVAEVRTLLEFGGMDLNQGDYDHRTALHLAANEGHLEVVKLLCEAGADTKVKDRWGAQPVDDARKATKNATEIVSVLRGAVPLSSTDQHAATMRNLKDQSVPETTVLLAEEGADEGMTQLSVQEFGMGCTVLHQAALGEQLVIEKMLLERPPLVNFRDYDRRTALHIAASEGHVEICRLLVAKGAKVNRCDRWGGSPLDDARRERHSDVVKFLREQGAKFGSTSQVTNFITAASEGDTEEVQAFLEFGSVGLNEGDYDHRTALHLAANEGHVEVVRMLCEAGADVNVEDRWEHRPLDDARTAKKNSTRTMKVLLKHGAKSKKIPTKIRSALLGVLM